MVRTRYWVEKPIRIWSLPSSHEDNPLSRGDRQIVRCFGDDTQLEHDSFGREDFERPAPQELWIGNLQYYGGDHGAELTRVEAESNRRAAIATPIHETEKTGTSPAFHSPQPRRIAYFTRRQHDSIPAVMG
jgi:hypothetical protein